MANDLNGLIPDIYEALDVVSREQVGLAMAVSADNDVERAALGQEVVVPIFTDETATDLAPGVTPPDDGDNATGNVKIVLEHAKRVPVRLTGKDRVGLNHGPGVTNYRAGRFAQGFRTMANLIENYLASKCFGASRAVGTAGTTPFAAGVGDTAQALKALRDNGAPAGDMRMVVDSTAAAQLRSNGQLTKANEAGTDETLRTGTLLNLNSFMIGETGAGDTLLHTPGTAAGYLVNGAAGAGATVIPVDTGTGTIVAGDLVSFAGDSHQYVATGLTAGSLTIAAPGLRRAVADDAAVTVAGAYSANLAFSRGAFQMAARVPELPEEGDMAEDRQIVTDPFSGLSFEIAMYKQYRQVQYELSLCYGAKIIKPEHVVLLAG